MWFTGERPAEYRRVIRRRQPRCDAVAIEVDAEAVDLSQLLEDIHLTAREAKSWALALGGERRSVDEAECLGIGHAPTVHQRPERRACDAAG